MQSRPLRPNSPEWQVPEKQIPEPELACPQFEVLTQAPNWGPQFLRLGRGSGRRIVKFPNLGERQGVASVLDNPALVNQTQSRLGSM